MLYGIYLREKVAALGIFNDHGAGITYGVGNRGGIELEFVMLGIIACYGAPARGMQAGNGNKQGQYLFHSYGVADFRLAVNLIKISIDLK